MRQTIKAIVIGLLTSLAAGWWMHYTATWLPAATVVGSTTTYNGADEANFPPNALPAAGPYIFSLVATSTPATTSPITGLSVYLQQVGVSGQVYTLNASTFTTCNAACVQLVDPDVYEGGNIKVRWTITSGSATIKVSATPITP